MRMSRSARKTVVNIAGAAWSASVVTGLVVGVPAAAAQPAGPFHILAAVGDIACEPDIPENSSNPAALKCGSADLGNFTAETATAEQASDMHADAVALLGDEQYEVGKLADFQNSFDKTWGPLRALAHPAPGNHEYYAYTKFGDDEPAQNGAGYFGYFNGLKDDGTPRPSGLAGHDTASNQGWYSYDLGPWHVISLNVECESAPFGNDCSTTDGGLLAQETQWLARDLRKNKSACTLAYWHQPTFSAITTAAAAGTYPPSSAGVGSVEGAAAASWWKLLYAAHADLVLTGHEHVYARFEPMDPAGNVDRSNGIRQLTIGTGGEDLDTLARNPDGTFSNPNVVTGEDTAFGVAELRLGNGTYSWNFSPAAAGPLAPANWNEYHDSGTAACHA
jgi:hypothetical protein